jgi:hypothetical protein
VVDTDPGAGPFRSGSSGTTDTAGGPGS